MPRELRPGVVRTDLIRIASRVEAATPELARVLGDKTADRARALLTQNSHAYGTPTTASKGGPPAMISGTLADSVQASSPRPRAAGSWEVRVGLIAGQTPSYGHTPSHLYGMYLDKGDYPWLTAAYRSVARSGDAIAAVRASGWTSVI